VHRSGLIAARVLAAAALLAASPARAQPAPEATPDAGPDAGPEQAAKKPRAADQELSASLGMDVGGRVSPGGLHVAGAFLYQLSDQDWFDGGLSFTFGSGQAACFRDRDNDFLCDHGSLDGFGAELSGGVRRYFPGQGKFTPYARAGLGLRLVSFGGDDVRGLAIPLQLGGGVRARVADRISVTGGAELRVGPAFFNRDLGTQPHLGLAVHGGVEFAL
jgi:opacity protein-like surface antigen